MTLDFDLANVTVTEFGVGQETASGQSIVAVPGDVAVQLALREMAKATWDALQADENGPVKYDPSEKHAATEYLYLPTSDPLAEWMSQLHNAANLVVDTAGLANPDEVFCYFARFTDSGKKRLTAVRRAGQFKGVLKSRNRLVRMLDDTLKVIDDVVFRLDSEFDLLIDSAQVHILRPSGFEFAGKMQQAILGAVPDNIKVIQKDLTFVNFKGIEAYASKHPRAARYLASICSQAEATNIDKRALKELCKHTHVEVSESKGVISVTVGHEMGFLEVLDRRRYELELVKGKPERFKAASRTKLSD